MDFQKVIDKAAEKFYPDPQDKKELQDKYEEISSFIRNKYDKETVFAGSSGRSTCMKDDRDIDLFVKFPEDTDRVELENKGLEIGEKTFKEFDAEYNVEYAEHPYTKGEIDGFEVEIVPCYDTSPQNIKSAVDRSPHHAEWVRNNLGEDQKKDVVVLKKFLRASGLYGSSLKVRGFSGYLCEILISHYGSLEELLRAVESWGERKIIDPEKHHQELPDKLDRKFKNDSLVVIDPVDPERNVASVLTDENYTKFIYQSWRFLEDPGMNFFREEEISLDKFRLKQELDRRADFIVIEFDSIDKPEDIVYPQMRKTLKRVEKVLEKHDFRIFDSGFHVGDQIRIIFELTDFIPGIEYKKGPKPVHGSKHMKEFTSKYENIFIQGDRLYAKTERDYTSARVLLKDFLDEEPETLEEKGIPTNVADKMKNFRMPEPFQEDKEWLKFLVKKFHIEQ